ncbi:MAG: translational GTPase TypA [Reyranella sp.]|uniref:translational GTPase TypA n=1 Tax=Reyranella sp. TaxID=1929291 RepID=UPI001AD58615|nr:translational GTPase TypA [Reyranella sp.]MBN9086004.1 translational GTPase TypA [Reyranella sp.]
MDIRNVAIIAHVDHGKTTLVDCLLKQSGTFRDNQQVAERAMDSNDLERERGITILAKATSVVWKGTRVNIVDTPGHADFGGEVERILSMVDGVVLLVDAAEGPLPQTKFVLGKALRLGLKPIVLINKVDRSDARPHQVHDEVFDLFSALDASDEQLDFPTLFASARQGWAAKQLEAEHKDMEPLFDLILRHVPAPKVDSDPQFRMLVTTLEADPFLGRILTGRIQSGSIKPNTMLRAISGHGDSKGEKIEETRVTKLLAFRGLERQPIEQAEAGDIVAIAGFKTATVADTLGDLTIETALPAQPVDPPTLAMNFMVNDSPLAGREGDKVTTRMIRARLMREAEGNVAIRVRDTENADSYEVAGRGELQLGVLIETMRREGFELAVGRPRVLFQTDPQTGQRLEPIEEVVIDVDDAYTGTVVEQISLRKGELQDMRPSGAGKTRLVFYAPSRGLIGYHGEFLTDTRGTGVMNRIFHEYGPFRGPIQGRRNGALISNAEGVSVAYAMWNLEDRGPMFIDPGVAVYQGMLIGEHSRGNDLDVNVLKGKQLTNIRAAGKDEAVRLTPPRKMTLEQAIAYIEDDELVEVTPKSIRLRKRFLEPEDRKRARKQAAQAAE